MLTLPLNRSSQGQGLYMHCSILVINARIMLIEINKFTVIIFGSMLPNLKGH